MIFQLSLTLLFLVVCSTFKLSFFTAFEKLLYKGSLCSPLHFEFSGLCVYSIVIVHREGSLNSPLRSGQAGIRTLVALLPNGFQDRLVMTTSIPVHMIKASFQMSKKYIANPCRQVILFYNKLCFLSIQYLQIFLTNFSLNMV